MADGEEKDTKVTDPAKRGAEKRTKSAPIELRLVMAEFSRNPVLMAREIQQLREHGESSAIPDGHVVVKKDRLDALAAYEALGKVDDLKSAAAERDTLKTTLAQRDAAEARRKAAADTARALGWNEAAVQALADDKALTLELRDVEIDDGRGGKKTEKRGHIITGEGEAKKAELFDVAAARDYAVYLPALKATTTDRTAPNGPQAPTTRETLPPAPRDLGSRDRNGEDDAIRIARQRAAASF